MPLRIPSLMIWVDVGGEGASGVVHPNNFMTHLTMDCFVEAWLNFPSTRHNIQQSVCDINATIINIELCFGRVVVVVVVVVLVIVAYTLLEEDRF